MNVLGKGQMAVKELIAALAMLPEGSQVLRVERDDDEHCLGLGLDSATYEGRPVVTIVLRLPNYQRTGTY